MPQKSAQEVVSTYLDVLYNQRRLDLIPDLIADPTWRHAPGEVKQLSLAESIAGIEIFRVAGGKIVEIWNSREARGLWQAPQTF